MDNTRDFDTITDRLLISAPGAPLNLLTNYVRSIAIDVCERTLAWAHVQPEIVLAPGTAEYDYETPDDTLVQAIITSTINNRELKPVSVDNVVRFYPDWPEQDKEDRSTPMYVTQLTTYKFAVAPVPDNSERYKVKMHLRLKPARDATGMDKGVLDELEDIIIHGVLKNILILPNESWRDPPSARHHAQEYTYKIAEQRARSNLGAAMVPLRVTQARFI